MDLERFFPNVQITVPKRGDKKKLLDLIRRNAKSYRLEKMKRASASKEIRIQQKEF